MRRPSDLSHDYMLPNGLVKVWLSADTTAVDDIAATLAFSVGRPPECTVTCSATRLSNNRDEVDMLVQKIIDKTHRLLRAAPSGYHVDCFREVIGEWICRYRHSVHYLAAA